jgi:hypothetical protein
MGSVDQQSGPAQERLHESVQRLHALPDDQVQVVGHDDVREELDVGRADVVCQDVYDGGSHVRFEQRLAAMDASRHVERGPGQVRTAQATHAAKLAR